MNLRIIHIIASLSLLVGAGTLVGFAINNEQNARYKILEVDVSELDGMYFVDAAAVKDAILEEDSIRGTFTEDLALSDIATWVHRIPAVATVRVYPGLDHALHVHVTQREPVLRIHLPTNEPDLYLDVDGKLLPLSPHFTARVPVVHAENITDAHAAFEVIKATRHDPFWSAFIDQMVVQPDGQLEIIPRIGNARILIGNSEHLHEKLSKLFTFYHAQIQRGNLNDYKRIHLAYEGQVVGERYY